MKVVLFDLREYVYLRSAKEQKLSPGVIQSFHLDLLQNNDRARCDIR